MDWWTIVKRKNAFAKKNISLMKEIIEKIYMGIPADTVFTSDKYWEKFLDMVEASIPKEDINHQAFNRFKKDGKEWFRNFFLNYGRQRNYIEKIIQNHPTRYRRTDSMQDYYKESLMKGRSSKTFQFGKNLDNIMRDGKERTAKEAFLSLQDYYINRPDRSGGNMPTTAEVSGYLNNVAYKRYEKIKGRPNKYRWIGE